MAGYRQLYAGVAFALAISLMVVGGVVYTTFIIQKFVQAAVSGVTGAIAYPITTLGTQCTNTVKSVGDPIWGWVPVVGGYLTQTVNSQFCQPISNTAQSGVTAVNQFTDSFFSDLRVQLLKAFLFLSFLGILMFSVPLYVLSLMFRRSHGVGMFFLGYLVTYPLFYFLWAMPGFSGQFLIWLFRFLGV